MKSINSKIITLVFLSVVFNGLIIAIVGLVFSQNIVETDSQTIINLTTESKVQEMNSWLQSIEQSVNLFYDYCNEILPQDETLLSDSNYMNRHINQVSTLLEDAAANTENATTVFYRLYSESFSSDFGIFLVKDKNNAVIKMQPTDISLYEKTNRERVAWWYEPIELGKAVWLDPYFNENIERKVISYVIPLYRNNQAFGVVGMDIDFDKLVEMINFVSFHSMGHAMLINSDGNLLLLFIEK